MIQISLCMIVKNEETVLARCLESARTVADELIIVDTGSDDRTMEIARRYTDNIFSFPWQDDFAAARNFAFAKGSGDYLFWLDADDVLPPESLQELPALKKTLEEEQPDVLFCPYSVGGGTVFQRERFLRREANFLWEGRVHECIAPHGKVLRSPFTVVHAGSPKVRGARNLHLYQKWAAEEPLSGRDLFYYGRELYYNRLYTEAVAVLTKMLDGEGWHVNKIEACKILSKCYTETDEHELSLRTLFRSFLYGEPRASVLCEIAALFRKKNRLREATFWYETARSCKDFTDEGDFEEPHCRTLIPLIELTCCYYELGELQKSVACHRQAEALFPDHPVVLANRNFFLEHDLLTES